MWKDYLGFYWMEGFIKIVDETLINLTLEMS